MSLPIDLAKQLAEEIVEMWYAAEDCGESTLRDALEEAGEKNQSELAEKVFEGTVEMVITELLFGQVGAEVVRGILEYRGWQFKFDVELSRRIKILQEVMGERLSSEQIEAIAKAQIKIEQGQLSAQQIIDTARAIQCSTYLLLEIPQKISPKEALELFDKGEITEGRFADILGVDRLEARKIFSDWKGGA